MVKPNSVYFSVWCVLKYYAEAHLRVLDKVCPVCLELTWFHLDVMFFLKKKKKNEREKREGIAGQEWLRIREFKYLCEQFLFSINWKELCGLGQAWSGRGEFSISPVIFSSHILSYCEYFTLLNVSLVTIWCTNIN